MISLTQHDGMGLCICTMDEQGNLELDGDNMPSPNYWCPVAHTCKVSQVAFSEDGAHVISASSDRSVRAWDVAFGRQVRQRERVLH